MSGVGLKELSRKANTPARFPPAPSLISEERIRVGLLSGVAGYVDATGFVMLLGLFPAHLTGELVGAAVEFFSGHEPGRLTHLVMVPVFIASVAIAAIVARAVRGRGQAPLGALLTLMTLALVMLTASGTLPLFFGEEARGLATLVGGAWAVVAMGIQNTFMRESLSGSCPTTVMTGNLTQFVIELVNALLARFDRRCEPPSERARSDARLRVVSTALSSFLFGAALGGWMTAKLGPYGAALPAAIVGALTVSVRRQARA
ncbi:MAG: YoaK family protein [Pseudomonadota bacterium]